MEALMSTSNVWTVPIAVLNLPPKVNVALIMFARAVYNALLNNPSFPSPNPPLAVFAANIDAFEEAEVKAGTRAKGAAAFRDAKRQTVKGDLFHLRDYVQSVVEASGNPADGVALIESAHMSVRKPPRRETPELSAKNAGVSGKVILAAKAVARVAIYSFEYSLDQSTWTPVDDTMKSRTEISGLTSARVYYFRFRAFTRVDRRDYSQVVSLIVH
jgi:hypothetical protein